MEAVKIVLIVPRAWANGRMSPHSIKQDCRSHHIHNHPATMQAAIAGEDKSLIKC